MEKKRIHYIDVIEAVSMFAICFTHYSELLKPNYFDNFIDMFCFMGVSCFFMANGALLLNKENFDIKNHFRKTAMIFLVLLVWEAISLIYFSFLYKRNMSEYALFDVFSYFLGDLRWGLPTGHFWFIRALISIYIIFPLLKKCFDENPKLLLILIGAIIIGKFIPSDFNHVQVFLLRKNKNYVYFNLYVMTEYVPFGKYMEHLVYFLLGGFLHKLFYIEKRNIVSYQDIVIKTASVLGILYGGGYIYILKGISTGFKGNKFTQFGNGFASLGTLLLSISCFMLALSFCYKENFLMKVTQVVSKNTLGIFYIHCILLSATSYYLHPFIPCRGVHINGIKALIVLFLSLFITLIIRRIPLIKRIVQ